ncbi:MAG TPA: 2-hydroxychromene-2-carboxylate isomerase [Candidatus Binatia bacterium]|nr:2-hydroxychromene-2-carboxylate isomerase [Candidatus Binatia bacterium]
MPPRSVEFWFEFASTYSYPAAMRIEAVAARDDVTVVWRPFLLGPVFAAQGWKDSPFNIYPAKGRYMWRDLERVCAKHGLPFHRPSSFPRGSLLAARVACLAPDEPWCPRFVRAVYHANFVDDRDIADAAVVTDLLRGVAPDADTLVARATESETKDRLRRQTERAAALGIFGAPTAVVGDELFWGNDRLDDAIVWAAGRAPTGRA